MTNQPEGMEEVSERLKLALLLIVLLVSSLLYQHQHLLWAALSGHLWSTHAQWQIIHYRRTWYMSKHFHTESNHQSFERDRPRLLLCISLRCDSWVPTVLVLVAGRLHARPLGYTDSTHLLFSNIRQLPPSSKANTKQYCSYIWFVLLCTNFTGKAQ